MNTNKKTTQFKQVKSEKEKNELDEISLENKRSKHYDNAHEFQSIVNTLIYLYDTPYVSWSIGGGEFNIYKTENKKELPGRITFNRDYVVDLIRQDFIKLVTDSFLKLIDDNETVSCINEDNIINSDNLIDDLLHRIEVIIETLKLEDKYFTYDRIGYSTYKEGIIKMYVMNTEDNKEFNFPINIISALDNKNLVKVVKEAYESIIKIEKESIKLPSAFKHNDQVMLSFYGHNEIKGCIVHAVHFTASKVKYDLNIPIQATRVGEKIRDEWTRIYNVDSCFVTSTK